ncbi:MAG: type VI secretion system contractile sheath protein TssC, partial [Marinirhabdus sp.]
MAKAQKKQQQNSGQSASQQLERASENLAKYGGFDLLEASIDGVQNLNPERKARKKIFLTESSKRKERKKVKKTLEMWSSILSNSDDVAKMIEESDKKSQVAHESLKSNVGKAIKESRELERSYRSMALFFKNTEQDKIKNVTIVNAELDQVKDLDNTRFIDAIAEELKSSYDRLDLRDNYGLMVIP